MEKMSKRIFICADHGLAIIYFLQSEVVSTLVEAGVEVVVLTDDALMVKVEERFGQAGLTVEGLRLAAARKYEQLYKPSIQWWLHFLRRAGASNRINLEAVNGFIRQVEDEAHLKRQILFPLMRVFIVWMRRSRLLRKWVTKAQNRFTPEIYKDLFEKYNPCMVVAATPGWRLDRYLLREASKRGIKTVSVIVGWDNSSSYSLPGAPVNVATCWSEIQKDEMVKGADWDPRNVNIGGIPSYDGYIRGKWLVPKDEYFRLHSIDPDRRLISYASSFVSFSPNLQNIEALARLVTADRLVKPSQLLIRLHPTHFSDVPRYRDEREKIQALAAELDHVHVVEPLSLGGEMGHYSGEDMPEKSSMMAYSDVMVTVYSTMVVEASVHGTPVVSLCIDSSEGWHDKFTLPLSKIGGWPTHQRYRDSMAGREAIDESTLKEALNHYLENPEADQEARNAFLERECTYLDGSAGKRTAQFLLSQINNEPCQ
jgi:CDP-glycerol glycerophosphotransferase (TagB/SpsB family)